MAKDFLPWCQWSFPCLEFIAGVLSVHRVRLVRDEWGYHLDVRVGQYWGYVG